MKLLWASCVPSHMFKCVAHSHHLWCLCWTTPVMPMLMNNTCGAYVDEQHLWCLCWWTAPVVPMLMNNICDAYVDEQHLWCLSPKSLAQTRPEPYIRCMYGKLSRDMSHIYGVIRCINTILANPTHVAYVCTSLIITWFNAKWAPWPPGPCMCKMHVQLHHKEQWSLCAFSF